MELRTQNILYINQNINTNQLTEADRISIGSYIMKEIGHDKIIEKGRGIALFFEHLSDGHLETVVDMIRESITKNKITISLVLKDI